MAATERTFGQPASVTKGSLRKRRRFVSGVTLAGSLMIGWGAENMLTSWRRVRPELSAQVICSLCVID